MRALRNTAVATLFLAFIGFNHPPAARASPGNPSSDCNANTVGDAQDIASGASFDANANGVPDECECDRLADGRDAYFSGRGTGLDGLAAADDFLVPKGVHRVQAFSVQIYSTSSPPRAVIELRRDDCATPGSVLREFYSSDVRPVIDPASGRQAALGNLLLYDFLFLPDELWLDEGRYWISAMGVGDGSRQDQAAWATSGDGQTRGASAHILGLFPHEDTWTPVEVCFPSAQKTDLALCVTFDLHRVLWDNGRADAETPPKALNLARAKLTIADDFLLPPCDEAHIAYIDAVFASNLRLWQFVAMDIYDDAHGKPGDLLYTLPATRTTVIRPPDQSGLRFEHAEFCNLDLALPGGRRYWLSLRVTGGGAANDRTHWITATRCELAPCTVQLSQALGKVNFEPWTDIEPTLGRKADLAFRVIGRPVLRAVAEPCPPSSADINNDGRVTVNDWFAFLQEFLRRLGI